MEYSVQCRLLAALALRRRLTRCTMSVRLVYPVPVPFAERADTLLCRCAFNRHVYVKT